MGAPPSLALQSRTDADNIQRPEHFTKKISPRPSPDCYEHDSAPTDTQASDDRSHTSRQ